MSWAQLSIKVPGQQYPRRAEFVIRTVNPVTIGLLIMKPGYRIAELEINFDWDAVISFNWEASCTLGRLGMKIPGCFESYKYFRDDPTDPRAGYRRTGLTY